MDCLDTIPNGTAIPDDLTLTELILFSHVDKLVPIVTCAQRSVSHGASKEADDKNIT